MIHRYFASVMDVDFVMSPLACACVIKYHSIIRTIGRNRVVRMSHYWSQLSAVNLQMSFFSHHRLSHSHSSVTVELERVDVTKGPIFV